MKIVCILGYMSKLSFHFMRKHPKRKFCINRFQIIFSILFKKFKFLIILFTRKLMCNSQISYVRIKVFWETYSCYVSFMKRCDRTFLCCFSCVQFREILEQNCFCSAFKVENVLSLPFPLKRPVQVYIPLRNSCTFTDV